MSPGPRSEGRRGILPFVIERGEPDDVTARAGLPLVVETMRALGVDELAQAELPEPQRRRGFTPAQKLEALITLRAAGGDRVEEHPRPERGPGTGAVAGRTPALARCVARLPGAVP